MKDLQAIQEKLKELPRYSLNTEQKTKILSILKTTQNKPNRSYSFKPLFSGIAIIVVIFILFITVYPEMKEWYVTSNHEQEQVELKAEKGVSFELDSRQKVVGIKDKVAILDVFNHFVAQDKRRVAKLMVFFWGNPDKLIGEDYRVEAMNRYGEKVKLSEGTLYGALQNEDAHALTKFKPFPKEGEWQLSFFAGNKLYGEFTLNVLPPFPKTQHYTWEDSPKEIPVGKEMSISIESSWKKKKEIKVILLNAEGDLVDQKNFKMSGEVIDADTYDPVYIFEGKIKFPSKGNWTMIIDGERTNTFRN